LKKRRKVIPGRVRSRWTKEDVTTLEILYSAHSNEEIARILKRKISSVRYKAHDLGLYKCDERLQEMGQQNIAKRWRSTHRIRRRSART
jgi:hypothetical protein